MARFTAGGAIEALARDARHALRRLLHDRWFTAAAVLILGLGIGANTAIFSVVNAALFREQPIADPERLVDIYQNGANTGGADANSYPVYLDIATYTDVFAGVTAASVPIPVQFLDRGTIRPAVAQYTTASYLSVLGLKPSLGRWLNSADDRPGVDVAAVIGHRAWTERFAADPSVLGRTIRIEGVPVTIVGVGPVGHRGTLNVGLVTDFWLPIAALRTLGGPPQILDRRPVESPFFVKARLRDGVTLPQARAAMDALGARLARDYPTEDPGKGITVLASADVRVHPQMDLPLKVLASALLTVVGLVLAIACSNLATLLLVRGAARAKDVAVRLAMGATRRQLVVHLLMESLLLSAAGGAAGCLFAWWGLRSLRAIELPVVVDFGIDARVLVFASALSFLTGIAFGLTPALKATRVDLVPALRDEGGTRSADRRWFTLKNALIVFQVAVSVVLLSATSIFLHMVLAARAQRAGFAVDGIAMLRTDARYAGYAAVDAKNVYDTIRERVAAMPGVLSVALVNGEPMQTTGLPLKIDGAAVDTTVSANSIWAGPGFFETLRIPILLGRAFDVRDGADAPRVAIVSEAMARKYFGGINALGRRFRIDRDGAASDSTRSAVWIEVIGIAKDTGTADLQGDLVDPTPYLFYRLPAQWGQPSATVIARTSLDVASLVGAMQRELRAVDPALPVLNATTMARYLEGSLAAPSAVATALGILGALGLSLAAIGLHAVVAFAVSLRSREIGIRMALGARSGQVVWSVTRDVAVLLAVGTIAGLALSKAVVVLLGTLTVPAAGVEAFRPRIDPIAFLAIAGFMAVAGLAAAFGPARRAAKLDPQAAIRTLG